MFCKIDFIYYYYFFIAFNGVYIKNLANDMVYFTNGFICLILSISYIEKNIMNNKR